MTNGLVYVARRFHVDKHGRTQHPVSDTANSHGKGRMMEMEEEEEEEETHQASDMSLQSVDLLDQAGADAAQQPAEE